ncbi:MAG: bifunctional UDP-sugar hydrolase/5'-nucleotidase [bacterium]
MSDRVTLLFTSDLHGRLGHVDPLTQRDFPGGATRVATRLAEARARVPDAIYLDLGDLAQGTPLSWLRAREAPMRPHPMVRALDVLGCEAMVVGNHEFNFGMDFLKALRRDLPCPLLAANVLGADDQPFFEAYHVFERGGRRIAVLGLTTPQVPRWEEPWNYGGLRFVDAVRTAHEWVPRLRQQADAVVVAAHLGWSGVTDGGLVEPVPAENPGAQIANEVEGIDVLLMAHTHRFDERRGGTGAVAIQAGWGGLGVGEVSLTWNGSGRPAVEVAVHRTEHDSPEPAFAAGFEEELAFERREMDVVLGEASAPFPVGRARYEDNAILSLFHRVQLDAAKSDISSTALFRLREELAAGPIRRRDVFRIYPFENDLTILEITVGDVLEYLEETALAYAGPGESGELPPLDPRFGHYNHDVIAGAEYVIDPAQPIGRRIVSLTFRGEELPAHERLTLALTSYRAQGGGGYRALTRARVVERTGKEMRGLIERWIRERGRITPEVDGHWRVIDSSARVRG